MQKNVQINVHISFLSDTRKSDIENILKNLNYEPAESHFIFKTSCNFIRNIVLDIKDIDKFLSIEKQKIKNKLEFFNIKNINFIFSANYDN